MTLRSFKLPLAGPHLDCLFDCLLISFSPNSFPQLWLISFFFYISHIMIETMISSWYLVISVVIFSKCYGPSVNFLLIHSLLFKPLNCYTLILIDLRRRYLGILKFRFISFSCGKLNLVFFWFQITNDWIKKVWKFTFGQKSGWY